MNMKLKYLEAHHRAKSTESSLLMKSSSSLVSVQLNKCKDEFLQDINCLFSAVRVLSDPVLSQKFSAEVSKEEAEQVIQFYNSFVAMKIQEKDLPIIAGQIDKFEKKKKMQGDNSEGQQKDEQDKNVEPQQEAEEKKADQTSKA